jgi:ADP-dependent NAD(P)H-hydrate dehydratase
MSVPAAPGDAIAVDTALLQAWPLPLPDADGDKEARGRALVIAGSAQMPGAAWLAAVAALRAGAGKLTVATAESVSGGLALRLPEARVIGLRETAAGGLWIENRGALTEALDGADAVLLGPGLQDAAACVRLVGDVLASLDARAAVSVILDAAAMEAASLRFSQPVLLTPHGGEMARLCGADKETVVRDAALLARETARSRNAVVALKGATTWIAAPDGRLWRHAGGNVGLATSGSGDALAGIACGLAARGSSLEQAAVWAVALHARAGEALAGRLGPLGYLASELLDEVPGLMHALQPPGREQVGR